MARSGTFEVLCQVKSKDVLLSGSAELEFCENRAEFAHREACEFIFWLGYDEAGWKDFVAEMELAGCREDFVKTFQDAKDAGAQRLLLFV